MAYQYTAIIRKDPETDFWVECTDIACFSSGKTEEEAKKNFADCLKFYFEGIKEDNKDYKLPPLGATRRSSPRMRMSISPPIHSKSMSYLNQDMAQ